MLFSKVKFRLIILATLFLTSWSIFAQLFKPDWVKTGKSKKYPDELYLVGVGTAENSGNPSKDKNLADDSAKAKLAEQIKVTVESELESYISEQVSKTKSKTTNQVNQKVSWLVKSKVKITLEGLQFPERYYDRMAKTYYSLAVLNRAQASALYLGKASELRQLAEHYSKEALAKEKKGDYFTAFNYYQRALSALSEAIVKEKEASVIAGSPVFAGIETLSPWELQTKIDNMRELLKVGIYIEEINPDDPGSNVVASAIAQGFRANNIKLGSVSQIFSGMSYESILRIKTEDLPTLLGDRACFLVVGRVEAKKSSETMVGSMVYYFYKSRADLKMLNISTGEVIADISFDYEEDTKAAKSQPAQAAAESLQKAGNMLAEKLLQAFDQYLNPPEVAP